MKNFNPQPKIKKVKKINRKLLKKKLDTLAKTLAKKRDNYICQYCGIKCEGSNAHGSHVIPISHGDILRWDLQNIKCLCYHHHLNWWHKNPTEASEWFREKFPDRMEYLNKKKNEIKKYTDEDLEALYKTLLKLNT